MRIQTDFFPPRLLLLTSWSATDGPTKDGKLLVSPWTAKEESERKRWAERFSPPPPPPPPPLRCLSFTLFSLKKKKSVIKININIYTNKINSFNLNFIFY